MEGYPQYRLYEVAGAAHAVSADNPVDHNAVARAACAAGDRWVRSGEAPLRNGDSCARRNRHGLRVEAGIARDGDLNARGGVRLPDLALARAQYIASDMGTNHPALPPEFALLSGNMVNLACEPPAGSDTDEPRFLNHGTHFSMFSQEVNGLQQQRLLLAPDEEALQEQAAASDVGKPGTCAGLAEE